MIFRTLKIDEHTRLYGVGDTWNTIYTVVVDVYLTKQDFIRRRNVCSICRRATHGAEEPDAPPSCRVRPREPNW